MTKPESSRALSERGGISKEDANRFVDFLRQRERLGWARHRDAVQKGSGAAEGLRYAAETYGDVRKSFCWLLDGLDPEAGDAPKPQFAPDATPEENRAEIDRFVGEIVRQDMKRSFWYPSPPYHLLPEEMWEDPNHPYPRLSDKDYPDPGFPYRAMTEEEVRFFVESLGLMVKIAWRQNEKDYAREDPDREQNSRITAECHSLALSFLGRVLRGERPTPPSEER